MYPPAVRAPSSHLLTIMATAVRSSTFQGLLFAHLRLLNAIKRFEGSKHRNLAVNWLSVGNIFFQNYETTFEFLKFCSFIQKFYLSCFLYYWYSFRQLAAYFNIINYITAFEYTLESVNCSGRKTWRSTKIQRSISLVDKKMNVEKKFLRFRRGFLVENRLRI